MDNGQKYPVYGGIAGYAGGAGNINTILIGMTSGAASGAVLGAVLGAGGWYINKNPCLNFAVKPVDYDYGAVGSPGYRTSDTSQVFQRILVGALRMFKVWLSTEPQGMVSINISALATNAVGTYIYAAIPAMGFTAYMLYTSGENKQQDISVSISFPLPNTLTNWHRL